MKLGDFLNSQATKLGLQNDPALIAILSNSELANKELDNQFAKSLDDGLMSLDSAKNNYGLRNHFSATILNSVDARLLEGLELDDETKAAIMAEKNSYNKIDLVKKVYESQIQKLKETDPDNKSKKTEYEAIIKKLNQEALDAKQAHENTINELNTKHDAEITNFIFSNMLSGKPYANKDLSPEDNVTVARTLIESELRAKGIILVKDSEGLKLKQANAPELDYYQDNKPITVSDFADQILSSKKMLAVNNGGYQAPNTPTSTSVKVDAPNTDRYMESYHEAVGK